MTTEQTIAELNRLIETCKDGELGYRAAATDARNTELETIFAEYAQQRGRFARDLQHEVGRLGGNAEDAGSISGTLLRGWMGLKSALSSGSAAAIIASCETGEEAAVAAYQWVVSLDVSGQTRLLVEKQCGEIQEAHARLLRLKAEEAAGARFPRNDA